MRVAVVGGRGVLNAALLKAALENPERLIETKRIQEPEPPVLSTPMFDYPYAFLQRPSVEDAASALLQRSNRTKGKKSQSQRSRSRRRK